jgi:hypothetical protein
MNELTEEQQEQIRNALENGRRIEAIKLHREASGQGLKESKEAIDTLSQSLISQDPQRYGKLSQAGNGCASMVVMGLTLATAVTWWFQTRG